MRADGTLGSSPRWESQSAHGHEQIDGSEGRFSDRLVSSQPADGLPDRLDGGSR